MCLSLLEMALLLLPPLLLAIALTIHQRLPKDRQICIGRTRGHEKTLVKSLLYTLAAPQMRRGTLIAVFTSFLYYTQHWHMHTHVYNHLWESHTFVNLGSTRIHRKRVQCRRAQPELNLGSSRSADMPLMVSVKEKDWDLPVLDTFRFSCIVFGVSSSPFLLNATIHHHLGTFSEVDPVFIRKFLSSIYVDDVTIGSHDVDSAYMFYLKSGLRLSAAGFTLRKFVTNSVFL